MNENNKKKILGGLHVASQTPVDDRIILNNYDDLLSLGLNNVDAYRYYEGLIVYVLENEREYAWVESELGALPTPFTYPSNIIVNGVNYSNRTFNFVKITTAPKLTDIDVYTIDNLINVNYASGPSVHFPAKNAILASSNFSVFPTLQGIAPFVGMKVLVKEQTDKTKNGDYVLTKLGNGTTQGWELKRLTYMNDDFYPRMWLVRQGPDAYKLFSERNTNLITNQLGINGDITFGFLELGTIITPDVKILDTTYDELVILVNTGALIKGSLYRITDYQTIYEQPDYISESVPVANQDIQIKMGPIEPLTVLALTNSILHSDAYQENYPYDKLKYKLDYVTPKTDTYTKGRIIERIDQWGNRTDFDHRNILFKRYAHLPDSQYSNDVVYCNYWDSSQDYPEREYNIITNTPNLSDSVYPTSYHAFICSTSGTRDFGSGLITVEVGDVIAYNGSQWVKLDGSTEYLMFNFTPFSRPQNNYIEGTYHAALSNSDAAYDVDLVFDLPNIVFLDNITYGNKFLEVCTNSTFCGETLSNTFSGPTTRLIIGFKQRDSCIGNTVQYRCRNIKISENFISNRIQSIINVDIRGFFRENTVNYIYNINGIIDIEENNIVEFTDLNSSFDQNSNLKIRRNDIGNLRDLTFNNSGKNAQINHVKASNIRMSNFYENAGLFYCDFIEFNDSIVYQDSISYCKGGFMTENIFYGFCGYSDFGPRFIYNEVGVGFGRDLISQQYLGDLENQVSTNGYSNIFNSEVYNCTIGSNFSGNIVYCSLHTVRFPDFFQRNYIKTIANVANQTIDLSGIPELINPITTTIDGRSIKLTQQIFEDNFNLQDLIFQDTDVNGEDRYWVRAFSFSLTEAPFMNKSTTFANATLTSIGSGYENSAKISKVDLYSKQGAISQVQYYGSETSNMCVPSLDELLLMYANKTTLGIGGTDIYWSSSEVNATTAYAVDFSNGDTLTLLKTEQHNVLPIKYISHFDAVILTYSDEYGAKIVKSLLN
jgi:hypothetical protein